jgi:uncharacterized lipoprotein YddW (UPF0748 family)
MFLATILLATFGIAAEPRTLDAFDYPDAAAASKTWIAAEGTPPVGAAREAAGRVLTVSLPFASSPRLGRSVMDRAAALDLSGEGEFRLDVATDAVDALGQVTLYFRSGDGWYGSGESLVKSGWQTLRFAKASFRPEGKPAGWNQISGIRIAFWRGEARDAAVRVRNLVAQWSNIALILPANRPGDAEYRTSAAATETAADMLREIGLAADVLEETAVAEGALGKRLIAILAHNPRLDPKAAEALVRFTRDGGKLLACYTVAPPLQQVLGISGGKYVSAGPTKQFAQMRFLTPDIPGMPAAVRQDSWNIIAAEPVRKDAAVIARWFTPEGRSTPYAAAIQSDAGAFLSHIVLDDDRPRKKQMLAALLGRMAPALWPKMAEAEMQQAARVGPLDNLSQLARFVEKSNDPQAKEALGGAESLQRIARSKLADRDYPGAVQNARLFGELAAEAYLRAAPSRAPEGRAFWEHSGLGAYPGDWERTAKELAAGGFNMIVPNMLWGGLAHYPSDLLPPSESFRRHGDQIAQCVSAAHRHGIEVHVWKVNYNLSGAPREFVQRLRREGRTQASFEGEPMNWLCPSHPANFQLERDSMIEVARKYDVDGLHFDYIRYPDGDHCYCPGCRKRFEAERKRPVEHWPADCRRGALRDAFIQWRCDQITRLVEAVSRQAKKIKPRVKISAAVFSAYPGCRESVGQDWVAWVKAGYLDFICPMDYTESDLAFSVMVAGQLRRVEGRIPVYPGIGATASRTSLPTDRVVGQILAARSAGAAGFTVFNLDRQTIAAIVPGVGYGVGAKKAAPPHRASLDKPPAPPRAP